MRRRRQGRRLCPIIATGDLASEVTGRLSAQTTCQTSEVEDDEDDGYLEDLDRRRLDSLSETFLSHNEEHCDETCTVCGCAKPSHEALEQSHTLRVIAPPRAPEETVGREGWRREGFPWWCINVVYFLSLGEPS